MIRPAVQENSAVMWVRSIKPKRERDQKKPKQERKKIIW
jgi:hypothetical protein